MIARTQGYLFDPSWSQNSDRWQENPNSSWYSIAGKNSDENKTPQHGSDSGGGWDESIFAAEGIKWHLEAGEQCDIYSVEARSFSY